MHEMQHANKAANVHGATVQSFGEEWSHYDQSALDPEEARAHFDKYFSEFPFDALPKDAVGFDAGCGSGRWARLMAPRVGELHCVDASDRALAVAKKNLAGQGNCVFHHASVAELPFADGSMDFGYSLGVLHHVPDTQGALRACVRKLKPGAPFLVYLYYALENRPALYRALWRATDVVRRAVSQAPAPVQHVVTGAIAATTYFPLARGAALLEKAGLPFENVPLSSYRDASFYTMRTDAFDRFCTPLEQRFTRDQVAAMMTAAGLERLRFRDGMPYWCAVGFKRADA